MFPGSATNAIQNCVGSNMNFAVPTHLSSRNQVTLSTRAHTFVLLTVLWPMNVVKHQVSWLADFSLFGVNWCMVVTSHYHSIPFSSITCTWIF